MTFSGPALWLVAGMLLIQVPSARAASVCDGDGVNIDLGGTNPIPVRDQDKDKNTGDCTAQAGECVLDIWLKSNKVKHPWVNRGDIWNAENPQAEPPDAGFVPNMAKALQAGMDARNKAAAAAAAKAHGPAKPGNPPPAFTFQSYKDCAAAVEGQLGQDPPQAAYLNIPGSDLKAGLKGNHAIPVVGCSTDKSGVVQWKLHNSWGDNCGGMANCDGHGNITLPGSTFAGAGCNLAAGLVPKK